MGGSGLAARVDSVPRVPFQERAFRHVSQHTDPHSGIGARIHGGRWNPPASFSTLYLGLSLETVAAEWRRAAERQGLTLEDFLPREIYEFEVVLSAVLDLRPPATRETIGLSDSGLRADDARVTQQIGETAHFVGFEAVIAPSAAASGEVIAIYLDRLRPNSSLDSRRVATWTNPGDAPPTS